MILGLHMASSIKVTEWKVIKSVKSLLCTMELISALDKKAWANDKLKKLQAPFLKYLSAY